MTKHRFRL